VVSLYAPNGRVVGSPFYEAKLEWYDRLARWLAERANPEEALVLGGDFNVAPSDLDVWDAKAAHGGTHVSGRERAAFARLLEWGWSISIVPDTTRRWVATPGGTTGQGTSTRTSVCGSII
jgi:exodeoxyribonuclease-3